MAEHKKQKEKRSPASRVFLAFALVVLLAAMGLLGYIAWSYWSGQNAYDKIADDVFDEGDFSTLADFKVDWDALRAQNSDVVGWVYVPDTVISYPICWREEDDNYYLYHNFNNGTAGQFAAEYGCIMLSGANSPKWTDQINIIYGHHMINGSMFAMLADFANNNDLFNQHRTFYVLTPEGNFKLTSFAVDRVPGWSTDIVIPNFPTESGLLGYVRARVDESLVTCVPPAPLPSEIKQVFGFTTCDAPDDSYRIIVFCTVDAFLPAGSDSPKLNALVETSSVEQANEAVLKRME